MSTTSIVMVGYARAFLDAVRGRVPDGSITVLEEPDMIAKRNLGAAAAGDPAVAQLVPVAYHQSLDVLDVGAALHATRRFQAVLPALEYSVPAAAMLAAKLGLPGATEHAAMTLRDKLRLRAVASAAGLRNPRFTEVRSAADVLEFAASVGGPVVLKPANRQGSVGVHLLDDPTPPAVEAAWRATVAADEPGHVPDRALEWRFLVEERLFGPEYSVEALVRGGEVVFDNVTEKAVIEGPHPVEEGHVLPAPLDDATYGALRAALAALVTATGFDTGILHAEWILTADGPALVECAGRPPGDRLPELLSLAYDTHVRLALLALLSGEPVELPRRAARGAAIRFLGAEPGRVVRVDGVDEARRMPGVQHVAVDRSPGDLVRAWSSSLDRSGHVLATGSDAEQARDNALAAARTVRIVTEPVPEPAGASA